MRRLQCCAPCGAPARRRASPPPPLSRAWWARRWSESKVAGCKFAAHRRTGRNPCTHSRMEGAIVAPGACGRAFRASWSFDQETLHLLVLFNATEWRAHRDLLHKRLPPLGALYDRHTPQHHLIFVDGAMALRDPREFRLVLIPVSGVLPSSSSPRLRRPFFGHLAKSTSPRCTSRPACSMSSATS
jgi:hypothetical protein